MIGTGFTRKPLEIVPRIIMAPGADLDFYQDWNDPRDPWLESGDTIASASWAVSEGDGALVIGTTGHTTTKTSAWLSNPTLGMSYLLTCTVQTAQGREDSRSFWIDCTTR